MNAAPVCIGTGFKSFLFAVGELQMLHVEILADSERDALRYIRTGECLKDFPAQIREEIKGQTFVLLERK
jgi:hypothetical protein